MNAEDRFQAFVEEPGMINCEKCHSAMRYKRSGIYICTNCDWEYISEFGQVKKYIDEHGPSTAFQISQATGVDRKMVERYLNQGRLEPVYRRR